MAGMGRAPSDWQNEGRPQGLNRMSRSIDRFASPDEKIALFRSLFRGRDDMYPRRFENRTTGRSGCARVSMQETTWDRPRLLFQGVASTPNTPRQPRAAANCQ